MSITIPYTIGCDPEVFVISKSSGELIPAHGLVPGDKQKPFPVTRGAVQVDGMALEINTTPTDNFEEFNRNIDSVFETLRQMIDDDFDLLFKPSVVFTEEQLASVPAKARELGCDPDYNAYTLQANPVPVPPVPGLRTASGHIHIGIGNFKDVYLTQDFFNEMAKLVRLLDRLVGCASVLMDADPVRRCLYGAAGAFRVKPYGLEYRVPSNAWLTSTARRKTMFDLVAVAMTLIVADEMQDIDDETVVNAINASNVDECRNILKFVLNDEFAFNTLEF